MIDVASDIHAGGAVAARAETAKSVDELIAATGGGANAIFDFQHRVFVLPGARFAIDRYARATMFYIRLGNLSVSLTPMVLRWEFNIEAGSHDGQLIELAAQALQHVREVRPGDSIPKELIDGSASWTVEDNHRLLAKAKLLAQVARWFSQDGATISIENVLAMVESDIAAREEFQNAFAAIAQSLGMDRGCKQEIVDQIDAFARELCYIEALREYADQLRSIHEKVLQLARISKGDRAISEELARVAMLLKAPLAEFAGRFDRVDAQAGELLGLLCNPRASIRSIRSARDEIHSRLMPWAELFEHWQGQMLFMNHGTQENLHALYGWLAANYAPSHIWR